MSHIFRAIVSFLSTRYLPKMYFGLRQVWGRWCTSTVEEAFFVKDMTPLWCLPFFLDLSCILFCLVFPRIWYTPYLSYSVTLGSGDERRGSTVVWCIHIFLGSGHNLEERKCGLTIHMACRNLLRPFF